MDIVQRASVLAALAAASLPTGFRSLEVATPVKSVVSAIVQSSVDIESQVDDHQLEVGSVFPGVALTNLDGDEINTAEFAKGKYTLVDFWGPWCGYCVRELPDLSKLNKELSGESFGDDGHGFQMLSVSANLSESHQSSWRRMISNYKLDWPGHVETDDLQALQETYGVRGYPTKMLLDPEGKVISINPSLGDVKTIIENHVGQ